MRRRSPSRDRSGAGSTGPPITTGPIRTTFALTKGQPIRAALSSRRLSFDRPRPFSFVKTKENGGGSLAGSLHSPPGLPGKRILRKSQATLPPPLSGPRPAAFPKGEGFQQERRCWQANAQKRRAARRPPPLSVRFSQKSALPTVRGCSSTSRMLLMPVRYMTIRSKPRPKPAWRQEP